MNFKAKAHPIMILSMVKRFLSVLIIPAVKGLIQYLLYRRITGVISLEIVAVAVIFVLAGIRLYNFSVCVKDGVFLLKDGVFLRKCTYIDIKNISSVTVTSNKFFDILGVRGVNVNTEVGKKGKNDFSFKLKKEDAKRLCFLLYGQSNNTEIRFSAGKIALLSASASSALTGIIVGVPFINLAGKFLNKGLYEMFFKQIDSVSRMFNTYFPPVVNAFSLIFLIFYAISFVLALTRNMFFAIKLTKEKIEINSGLYFKRHRSFKKSAVNDLFIVQTPLMHLFKTFTANLSIGGYGGERGETATVAPALKENQIKLLLSGIIPDFFKGQKATKYIKDAKKFRRFLFLPCLYALLILAVNIPLLLLLRDFFRLILFVTIVLSLLDIYYAVVCIRDYRMSFLSFSPFINAKASKRFTICEMYAEKGKIYKITVSRTPADIKYGTCKIKISAYGESADTLKIKFLDYNAFKGEFAKTFGVSGIKQ